MWLHPILRDGDPEWDTGALERETNTALGWFQRASRGALTVTVTGTFETTRFTATQGQGQCNPMVTALLERLQRYRESSQPDTHFVGLTRVRDCPFAASGETPGDFIFINNLSPHPLLPADTLVHELGHNFGLPHAAATGGSLLSTTSTAAAPTSDVHEYGDSIDPMGSGHTATSFGAAGRAALGWGDGVYHVPATAGTHTLTIPAITEPGIDAIVLDDPISGHRYSLTHLTNPRTGNPRTPTTHNGVYLHHVNHNMPAPPTFGGSSYAHLMPWLPREDALADIGAGPGTGWISPTKALSITVNQITGTTATITVTVDPTAQLTDTTPPIWIVNPFLTVKGRYAFLNFTAAADQSGIHSYRITTSTGTIHTPHPSGAARWQQLRIRLPKSKPVTVTLTATDQSGNTATRTFSARAR